MGHLRIGGKEYKIEPKTNVAKLVSKVKHVVYRVDNTQKDQDYKGDAKTFTIGKSYSFKIQSVILRFICMYFELIMHTLVSPRCYSQFSLQKDCHSSKFANRQHIFIQNTYLANETRPSISTVCSLCKYVYLCAYIISHFRFGDRNLGSTCTLVPCHCLRFTFIFCFFCR